MAATLYGHAVESDLPLARLREGAAPRGRLTVRHAAEPPAVDGEPAVAIDARFSVHRRAGELVVFCERTGTYAVDIAARRVTTTLGPAGAERWEHRLASVVVPLLLAERGDLALHASAVATEAGAVLFCGASGSGKSTTAWALAERGCPVLADDGGVVTTTAGQRPLVWPGLAGVRLRARSGARAIVAAGAASADPVPLAAVLILGPRGGKEPVVERITSTEALTALMPHTVHARGPSQAAAFRGAALLARAVPVLRGTVPDDFENAGDHAEQLIRAMPRG